MKKKSKKKKAKPMLKKSNKLKRRMSFIMMKIAVFAFLNDSRSLYPVDTPSVKCASLIGPKKKSHVLYAFFRLNSVSIEH